jgi:Arc/MetJ-type ribon-helix-helix transcriptional regulator
VLDASQKLEGALDYDPPRFYLNDMNIRLPPGQRAWLEAQVAAGHFSSVDDAVAIAVSDLMAIGDDDLAWAKAYVDEGRAAAVRGEVVSLDDAVADMDTHIASLKR